MARKMLHDEKITKKRLGNPDLWKQLEAISRGTYVNHLGRGRGRMNHPPYTNDEYIRYSNRPLQPSTLQVNKIHMSPSRVQSLPIES